MLSIQTTHRALVAKHTGRAAIRCAVLTLVVGSLLVALLLLTGCNGLDNLTGNLTDAREHAEAVAHHSDQRIAALQAELADAPAGSAQSVALSAELTQAQAARDAVRDALAQADAAIAAATDPNSTNPDRTSDAVGTLAALLPEPIRIPAALGTALVLSLTRARQLKHAAASIAKSVDLAARADPELKARLLAQAPTLRSTQTPTAGRIVDETVGAKPMLKLPV